MEKTPNRTSDLLPLDQLCYPRWLRQVANSRFCKLRELAIWVLSFPTPALPIMALYHLSICLSSGIERRVWLWISLRQQHGAQSMTEEDRAGEEEAPSSGELPHPASQVRTDSLPGERSEWDKQTLHHEFPLAPNLMDVIQSHFQVCSWKISSVLYAGMPISIFPNKRV